MSLGSPEVLIAVTATLAATACALAGVFLVLRRLAMLADAISHAVLPGIVAGYFLARGPNLLAGFFGAAAAGLLTVVLVETLTKSRRVKEDSAIGIVFPALFALGVFVISRFFSNVHLDADAVLYGDLTFVPFETLQWGGRDIGPQALWTLAALTLLNALFLRVFYKELKLSTFDPGLAAALGFAPAALHYGLMSLVAVTTVGALSAVGAILVVALLVVPPVTASLLTRRLPALIAVSLAVGVLGAVGGYALSVVWDVSPSGMIASLLGVLFGLTLLFAPQQGMVAQMIRRRRQRQQFAAETLVVHLATHEGTAAQASESERDHLEKELRWKPSRAGSAVARAQNEGWLTEENGVLTLTNIGRETAGEVATR